MALARLRPLPALPSSSDVDGPARALFQAVELQPDNVTALQALAAFMKSPIVRSALLHRAMQLSPRDPGLMFTYSNALADEVRYTNKDPTANRSEPHLRALHKRWLKSLLAVSKTYEGKFVPNVFNNIGSAYKVLGKDRSAYSYYRRAAALAQPLRDGLEATGALKANGPQPPAFDPESLRRRWFDLPSARRDDYSDTLHSLDTVLRYLLAKQRRRRRSDAGGAESSRGHWCGLRRRCAAAVSGGGRAVT